MNRTINISALAVLLAVSALMMPVHSLAQTAPPKYGAVSAETSPHGFPLWYEDAAGRRVELCVDVNNPFCGPVTPVEASFPEAGFGEEGFYWSAEAAATGPAGSALLILALEAAFGGDGAARNGNQIVFGRLRLRIDLPGPGRYTILHPYGEKTFIATAAGRREINYTLDEGAMDPLLGRPVDPAAPESAGNPEDPALILRNFEGVLSSPIMQSLLVWDTFNTDPTSLDAVVNGRYMGDGGTPHTVVGSPLGRNAFTVLNPDGGVLYETNLFTIVGKVYTGVPAEPLAHDYPDPPEKNLQAVGPVYRVVLGPGQNNDTGYPIGFPEYYEDTSGLRLTICPASDIMCISDPIDPTNPESLRLGVGDEAFFWSADARIREGNFRANMVLGLEAAFAGDGSVKDGNQMVFARVRIRIDVLSPGTYTVTHPYGTHTFVVTQEEFNTTGGKRAINFTEDIGGFSPFQLDPDFALVEPFLMFDRALHGKIGPNLLTWPGFESDPALLINGVRYVGNPGLDHVVTPGPNGDFFRVEGPGGTFTTNLWAVSGKLYDPATFRVAPPPPNAPVAVNDTFDNVIINTPTFLDVLANDNLQGAAPNAAAITVGPVGNGTAVVSGTGIIFTPAADFLGTDQFSYTVTVNGVTSQAASVTVNVVASQAGQLVNIQRAVASIRGRLTATRGPSFSIFGTAPANARLTLEVDGFALATVQADRRGRWRFTRRALPGLTNPRVLTVITAGSPALNRLLTVR